MVKIRVIDLFSGAGGLSLGFEMAEFDVFLSVEFNKSYHKSYKFNHEKTKCLNEDITKIKFSEIDDGKTVDGIIGGPPCQGFSTLGCRNKEDYRNTLSYYFASWIDHFRPKFFVMENVLGILSMDEGKVVENIKTKFKEIGYSVVIKKLLAADYGVPQLRTRIFFVGSSDESILGLEVEKTHEKYLTVNDAFSDILDVIPCKCRETFYLRPPENEYQEYLRKGSEYLFEHIVPNHNKMVLKRLSLLKQGENVTNLPEQYKIKGFPNVYGRLHLDEQATTITGNCGNVGSNGNFIHPIRDSAISVREAARLQSFPDRYRFFGTLYECYKQVGNAVPPLLGLAVAKAIKKLI